MVGFFFSFFCFFFFLFPRLKKVIYAAPSIRGPHSTLAGKHCCEEHNSSNSKDRRCLLSFQKPWEWLIGQTVHKKSGISQLFAFFTRWLCSVYIHFPCTWKRLQDLRRRQKSWGEREGEGRGAWAQKHSEEGDSIGEERVQVRRCRERRNHHTGCKKPDNKFSQHL